MDWIDGEVEMEGLAIIEGTLDANRPTDIVHQFRNGGESKTGAPISGRKEAIEDSLLNTGINTAAVVGYGKAYVASLFEIRMNWTTGLRVGENTAWLADLDRCRRQLEPTCIARLRRNRIPRIGREIEKRAFETMRIDHDRVELIGKIEFDFHGLAYDTSQHASEVVNELR